MKDSSNKNIEISYLYRDAGNYKLHSSKVFSNETNLPLETIRHRVESNLIEGLYFVPEKWGIERLAFDKFDEEEDHEWHEIVSIELSNKEVDSMSDISNFLENIESENNHITPSRT